MPLSIIKSGALQGISATKVEIEVNTGEEGEAKTFMVGLPDAAVKESINRVESSIGNSGFRSTFTKTTINLAPGHIRKEGPLYDLPIALGILAATGQMNEVGVANMSQYLIAGELSLSGELKPVKGGLSLAVLAKEIGCKGVILPHKTASEAALVEDFPSHAIYTLKEAVAFLEGLLPIESLSSPINSLNPHLNGNGYEVDFSEVKGQHTVRRAVEISVAGMHNILIIGPPGSGKSMIAKRIPTIMPEPTLEEYIEILQIYSVAGQTLSAELPDFKRPYRSPHHTISDVGLLGGGSIPGPGEISLAHNGVLFLDELPEFKRNTLEVLRQPLENGDVTISRSAGKITFPSSFMLVAAMNPTPSGYTNKDGREMSCSNSQIQRYRSKISGPLLDRIDIHVEAPSVTFSELRDDKPSESSENIRERVCRARSIQAKRFSDSKIRSNAKMGHRQIKDHCGLNRQKTDLLQEAMERLNLSARAYDRVLKVARTIADLANSEQIQEAHLLEAIQYRNLDRELFY